MKFLEKIPDKINFNECQFIGIKIKDSLYFRCEYNFDVIQKLRRNSNVKFGVTLGPIAAIKERFEKDVKASLRGLPKDERDKIRPEINKVQKVVNKFNKNVYYAPATELEDVCKTLDYEFETGLYIDIEELYDTFYERISGKKSPGLEDESIFSRHSIERRKKFEERLAKITSSPKNLPIIDENLDGRKPRIFGHYQIKAIFGDGAFEALREIGWNYESGLLHTSDRKTFIEGLQWLDYNEYKYPIAIDLMESIGDYIQAQKEVEKQKEEEQKQAEIKEKENEKYLKKITENLKYNLDIPIIIQEEGVKNPGTIYLNDDGQICVRAIFGDETYNYLRSFGWKYQTGSILISQLDNDIETYKGIEFINNTYPDTYIITDKAVLEFQNVYKAAQEQLLEEQEKIKQSYQASLDKEFPKPDGLNYKGYQKAGIDFALQNKSTLIADEMGLGKTIQAIGTINANKDIKTALVVCPASLKYNWKKECQKWLVRDNMTVGIAEGKKYPDTDIVIINYDILEKHKPKIQERFWDSLIIDEFQYLKSQKAKRTQLVYGYPLSKSPFDSIEGAHNFICDELDKIIKKQELNQDEENVLFDHMHNLEWHSNAKERTKELCDIYHQLHDDLKSIGLYKQIPGSIKKYLYRTPIQAVNKIGLSGTPFENRPQEAWNTLHYFYPKKFNNFFSYAKIYCDAKANSFGWDFSGASNLDQLQKELRSSIMIRRLKKDVLQDLPDKQRQVIDLPSQGVKGTLNELESQYNDHKKIQDELKAKAEIAKINGSNNEYYKTIRDIRTNQKIFFEQISTLRKEIVQKKLPYVIEHIHNAIESGEKVVCFAHHNEVIEALRDEFKDKAVTIYGKDSNKKKRNEAVERFQNDKSCQVFIGSIRAAGVGLTLTESSLAVFAELDYNPMMLLQAEDRIHRIGQKNNALIQYLVFENSIDSKMLGTIIDKMENFEVAFDRGFANPQAEVDEQMTKNRPNFDSKSLDSRSRPEIPTMGTYGPPEASEAQDERTGRSGNNSKNLDREENQDKQHESSAGAFSPRPATAELTESRIAHDAEKLSDQDIALVHKAIKKIKSVCDGAKDRDDVGFNSTDAYIGDYLARLPQLHARQAVAGIEMIQKYKKQLGPELYEELQTMLKDIEYTSSPR